MTEKQTTSRVNNLAVLSQILRCPVDKGELRLDGQALVNDRLGVSYPVIEGIPDLRLPEDREDESDPEVNAPEA